MNSKFRHTVEIEKRARWRDSSAQAVNAAANDQHRTLEAFLQDPALQDSLGLAIDHCSR